MKAKIKLTVNGRQFQPGDIVTEKLNATDEAFLLREGYIEKEKSNAKAGGRQTEKGSMPTETGTV